MLGRFVRNPRTVGAVAPSSRALARAMVAGLNMSGGARIVELGPGTGAITREIVPRLGPHARCLAIDIDPAFVTRLKRDHPQIEAVCGSAADLPQVLASLGFDRVDHILSGLPFASLPSAVTERILDAIAHVLPRGGTFTTFQYVHGYRSPLASAFRTTTTRHLGAPPVRRLVWRNVPPAYVLGWRRT